MIQAVGYCRVSTDREDQANSFEAQQRFFKEYIQRKPNWELYKIYADEGISGTSTKKRTQFNHMINDAYDGKFQIIVAKEVSRFSRNILDTISYTRELKALGINVIFLNDGFCTNDPDSELRLSIMGSIAQEESRKTSTRVTWGQTRQMEQGVVFGRSMLGYDVANGKMTIDPEGAELVKLIFHKYAVEKMGTSELSHFLMENGYRTYSVSCNWSASYLIKLLKNEKYIGDLIQKKTYTPNYLTHEKKTNHGQVEKIIIRNHHAPIIDREIWALAQAELRKNNKHGNVPAVHSNKHLFSGKIRCGKCGSSVVSRVKKNRDGTGYRRWSCSRATRQGCSNCNVGRLIRDDDALNMVKIALTSLQIEKKFIVSNLSAFVQKLSQAGESGITDSLERLQSEIKKTEDKKSKLLDTFLEGTISKEDMQTMKHMYEDQRDALQSRLTAAEERMVSITNNAQIERYLFSLLDGEQTSEIFYKSILDSITVFRDRHIELRFNNLSQVFYFAE